MAGYYRRQAVAFKRNTRQVVRKLLKIELLLITKLQDSPVGVRISKERVKMYEERIGGCLRLAEKWCHGWAEEGVKTDTL